jgi:hypothetical protein
VVSPKFQPALNAVTFAAAMSGLVANFFSRNRMVPSVGRWYIHDSSPSANMFFARPESLRDSPESASASMVMPVRSMSCTLYASSDPSSSGFVAYPTFARARLVKSWVSTMIVPPRGTSARLAFSAAGFIATRTSGRSPGVMMS